MEKKRVTVDLLRRIESENGFIEVYGNCWETDYRGYLVGEEFNGYSSIPSNIMDKLESIRSYCSGLHHERYVFKDNPNSYKSLRDVFHANNVKYVGSWGGFVNRLDSVISARERICNYMDRDLALGSDLFSYESLERMWDRVDALKRIKNNLLSV